MNDTQKSTLKTELSKKAFTKEKLIEKVIELQEKIDSQNDEILRLKNRKNHMFTATEVNTIKDDPLSIRKKAEKYSCAKRTIEKIMKDTYFDESEEN